MTHGQVSGGTATPTKTEPHHISRWGVGAVGAVIVIVVIVAAAWSMGFFASKSSATPPPPATVNGVTFVHNGSLLNIPAGSYYASPVLNLTNQSQWTLVGSWWTSNGTTNCLMSQGFYHSWNTSVAPKDCDGFGYLGSPGHGGPFSYPENTGFLAGYWLVVWYNLSPTSSTLVNVTSDINAIP